MSAHSILLVGLSLALAAGLGTTVPAHAVARDSGARSSENLSGVNALSSTDVWAVGGRALGRHGTPLATHWDGHAWTSTATPSKGTGAGFNAVAAVSPSNVWAVGGFGKPHCGCGGVLIEHWNGTKWTISRTPKIAHLVGAYLSGVAAVSPSDVWAVGLAFLDNGRNVPLVEHWDGTTWSRASVPPVPAQNAELAAVTAVSRKDVWAVGQSDLGILAEHWDGTRWTRVAVKSPGTGPLSAFFGVSALSSTDVWAVGAYDEASGRNFTLAEHFDGHRWTQVATPSPHGSGPGLYAVSAASASDVWAVGSTGGAALIEHWNGKAWRVAASPAPRHKELAAVASISADDAWTVGADYGSDGAVTEHWDGTRWRSGQRLGADRAHLHFGPATAPPRTAHRDRPGEGSTDRRRATTGRPTLAPSARDLLRPRTYEELLL